MSGPGSRTLLEPVMRAIKRPAPLLLGVPVCLAIFATIQWLQVDWSSLKPAFGMPNGLFNESIRSVGLRQPSNSWSSLAFALIGLLVLADPAPSQAARPLPMFRPPVRRLFAVSLIFVGLGSAFYHASMSFVGQVLDVSGMYLIATFILMYVFIREDRLSTATVVLAYVLTNVALVIVLVLMPEVRRWLFALLIVVGLALEARHVRLEMPRHGQFLLASALTLAFAYGIWIVDNAKLLFDPYSWLQGHAVWHVMGSVATYLLYCHYLSEAELA